MADLEGTLLVPVESEVETMGIVYVNWLLVLFFFVCAWLSLEALTGEPKRTALRPIPIDSDRRRARNLRG